MALITKRHLFALIGDPVSHSLSPVIHNAALKAVGFECRYETIQVAASELATVVKQIRVGAYLGANVTIPHKENVVQLMDQLTPVAASLEAVNTITVIENTKNDSIKLLGDNTDVVGFSQPLDEYANLLRGSSCLVWGSGGAARAVVYALLNNFEAGQVILVSRSLERANRIKEILDPTGARVSVVPWSGGSGAIHNATLLVNATPLGMNPNSDTTPCSEPALFSKDHIIYDLVYNPQKTRLLRDGERRGAITIGGLEMLIGQASQSFLAWTGTQMPVDIVRGALARHLEKHE